MRLVKPENLRSPDRAVHATELYGRPGCGASESLGRPVHARPMMRSGPYTLWTIPRIGYVQTGQLISHIAADRTDIGPQTTPLLRSDLADTGGLPKLSVRYGARNGGSDRLPLTPGRYATGTILSQHASLTQGYASATLRMRRPGIAVLSASYDPGWTATVNGHRQLTRMVAPALVAVDIPAGTDHISFHYRGYHDYPELLALAALTFGVIALGPFGLQRMRRRRVPMGSAAR
jgi:hypothetical protein